MAGGLESISRTVPRNGLMLVLYINKVKNELWEIAIVWMSMCVEGGGKGR